MCDVCVGSWVFLYDLFSSFVLLLLVLFLCLTVCLFCLVACLFARLFACLLAWIVPCCSLHPPGHACFVFVEFLVAMPVQFVCLLCFLSVGLFFYERFALISSAVNKLR